MWRMGRKEGEEEKGWVVCWIFIVNPFLLKLSKLYRKEIYQGYKYINKQKRKYSFFVNYRYNKYAFCSYVL